MSKKESERLGAVTGRSTAQSLTLFFSLLLLGLLLPSCTSIRPVIKIGLLAPFEGLHRQRGYAEITAVRQAIADFAPADVAVMPLALDDAAALAQTERATHKLLQDHSLRALIGPYSPSLLPQMQPIVTSARLPWFMPLAINPTVGFVQPDQAGKWALPLLTAAAEYAQRAGRQRLILAGWTPGWPQLTEEQVRTSFALPLLISDELTVIHSEDTVFWLGSPEAGARYLARLRTQYPALPFLLGPQADSPIFAEHTPSNSFVFLLIWVDDGYEQWLAQHPDQSPTTYLTYRATQQAIAQSVGQPLPHNQSWRMEIVVINRD